MERPLDARLDDAHRDDGLRALTTAVADLTRTTLPGQPVPGLLPNGSSNPAGRLNTFAAALRNYRQFADGAAPPPNPEHEPDDADGEDVDLAREVGVPPWKLKTMRSQARGWDSRGLATALKAIAVADADVKGAAADADYALESAVRQVAELIADDRN